MMVKVRFLMVFIALFAALGMVGFLQVPAASAGTTPVNGEDIAHGWAAARDGIVSVPATSPTAAYGGQAVMRADVAHGWAAARDGILTVPVTTPTVGYGAMKKTVTVRTDIAHGWAAGRDGMVEYFETR